METLFILNRDRIDRQGLYENTPVGGNVPILRNDQYRVKQEKILRTSLTSGFLNDQIIELGVEVAINNYDQIFNQEKYL